MRRQFPTTARASMLAVVLLAGSAFWLPGAGTAAPLNLAPLVAPLASQATPLYTEVQRRGRTVRRTTTRGPRGNVTRRTTVTRPGRPGVRPGRPGVRPPVVRPGVRPGRWARPSRYYWRPGGAIAAGAAIGFLGAAAVTWANAPAPGMCWYYTSPSRRSGFWDYCP